MKWRFIQTKEPCRNNRFELSINNGTIDARLKGISWGSDEMSIKVKSKFQFYPYTK